MSGNGDTACPDLESCDCGPGSFEADAPEIEFGDHRLDRNQLTVRATAFRLLLEEGRPVAVPSVAAEAGVGVATTIEVLEGFADRGNTRLSGDQVVGMAGLSVEFIPHRIHLAIGRRWTWCALDAVGIVGAVGEGVIRSETGHGPVAIHIRNGDLAPTNLAVFVADGYGMTSSVDQWCPLVNFFFTFEAATTWAQRARVPGKPVAVTSIAPQVIERWRSILDHRPLG